MAAISPNETWAFLHLLLSCRKLPSNWARPISRRSETALPASAALMKYSSIAAAISARLWWRTTIGSSAAAAKDEVVSWTPAFHLADDDPASDLGRSRVFTSAAADDAISDGAA